MVGWPSKVTTIVTLLVGRRSKVEALVVALTSKVTALVVGWPGEGVIFSLIAFKVALCSMDDIF